MSRPRPFAVLPLWFPWTYRTQIPFTYQWRLAFPYAIDWAWFCTIRLFIQFKTFSSVSSRLIHIQTFWVLPFHRFRLTWSVVIAFDWIGVRTISGRICPVATWPLRYGRIVVCEFPMHRAPFVFQSLASTYQSTWLVSYGLSTTSWLIFPPPKTHSMIFEMPTDSLPSIGSTTDGTSPYKSSRFPSYHP